MNNLSKICFSIVFNWRKRTNSIIDKPIHIRASQQRKTIYLPTGIKIPATQWDEKNKRITNHPLSDIFNKKLYDQLFKLENFEIEMVRASKGEWIPVDDLKDIENILDGRFKSFNDFCKYELEFSTNEHSTRNTHKSKLNKFFREFRKNKPVAFRELNVSVIKQYDRFVKSLREVNSQNTVHGYHKVLKSYINKAISEDLIKENPYDKYKVKKEREENIKRVWLSLDEIHRIENLEFKKEQEQLYTIKQLFLICAWCGFRFSTAISLVPSDIKQTKEGLVIEKLKIAKTNKRLFMPLYLLGDKNENGLTKPEQLFKDLLDQRNLETGQRPDVFKEITFFDFSLQHYNRELKVIAKLANIDKHCTSHIGRRSFASIMVNDFGLSLQLVKLLMQHSDIRTTISYTNPSDEEIIRELKRADIQF